MVFAAEVGSMFSRAAVELDQRPAPAFSVRGAAPWVAMSSASTLARRAARLARANAGRLVGDLAVGSPRPRSAHRARSAFLNHDGTAPRELAHVQPWLAFGREVFHARGFTSASVAHRRAGDPASPGAADAGAGVGPDTRASPDPKPRRDAASDASSDAAETAAPGQSRIVRVANFVARDLLTAGSLGELVAKMREHRDMAYLVATREASPFPFVFRAGCKFDERGAFSGGDANALCGPCDAASANAARLAEDPEARPIACTLEPRECFKTQQYTYFAAWMFLCYAGFAALHAAAKAGAARLGRWADAGQTDRLGSSETRSTDVDAGKKTATTTMTNDDGGFRGNEGTSKAVTDDHPEDEGSVFSRAERRAREGFDFLARRDPFGPRFLNFRDPSETWTALIAATLNFSRTAEIVRTVGLMFAYRKVGWWVVSAASAFRRHRRWM